MVLMHVVSLSTKYMSLRSGDRSVQSWILWHPIPSDLWHLKFVTPETQNVQPPFKWCDGHIHWYQVMFTCFACSLIRVTPDTSLHSFGCGVFRKVPISANILRAHSFDRKTVRWQLWSGGAVQVFHLIIYYAFLGVYGLLIAILLALYVWTRPKLEIGAYLKRATKTLIFNNNSHSSHVLISDLIWPAVLGSSASLPREGTKPLLASLDRDSDPESPSSPGRARRRRCQRLMLSMSTYWSNGLYTRFLHE